MNFFFQQKLKVFANNMKKFLPLIILLCLIFYGIFSSYKKKILSKRRLNEILNHIDRIGMSNKISNLFKKKHTEKILNFMKNDKKNNSNKINLILRKFI